MTKLDLTRVSNLKILANLRLVKPQLEGLRQIIIIGNQLTQIINIRHKPISSLTRRCRNINSRPLIITNLIRRKPIRRKLFLVQDFIRTLMQFHRHQDIRIMMPTNIMFRQINIMAIPSPLKRQKILQEFLIILSKQMRKFLKKNTERCAYLIFALLLFACSSDKNFQNSALKNSAVQNKNYHYYSPPQQHYPAQYAAPTYYQAPQPYYPPQNYQAQYQARAVPNSRSYSNPYDNPPSQNPYYDSDQYYVAPNSYSNLEDVQPKKSTILNSLNY